ncbi:hypothetical protein J5N97_011696 [Dioscorea zingiberensis]|uniref:Methyltransferase type 11 domain-containing protein n=1 Tax=Dioscorea zingiberensis TaxID=325984 RepID=A0A9D5D1I6_9LILI|nr:hypothetical protein J5N97_011696 [Dioscorea zingiberensis]
MNGIDSLKWCISEGSRARAADTNEITISPSYLRVLLLSPPPPPPPRYANPNPSSLPIPRSSCDASLRPALSPARRFSRIQSSRSWRNRVAALSSLFLRLRTAHLLSNSSRILCVFSGAGHEVAALRQSGVIDVTGVDLIDFPPLVSRADPHNLPFFDNVFDLGFSSGLAGALFPARFVGELERTVRKGGAVALVVERCGSEDEVASVKGLFRKSNLVEVSNVTLSGSEMTLIVMRVNGVPP